MLAVVGRYVQVCAAVAITSGSVSAAIDPSGTVVLYNDSDSQSIEIANYYAVVHPEVRLLGLSGVSSAEEVTQDHYLDVIRPQVLAGIDDSTELIVTTKGLPLRIHNTSSNPGTYDGWRGSRFGMSIPHDWWASYSSLESELTRIDVIDSTEAMGDQAYLFSGSAFGYETNHHAANPYYNRRGAFERSDPANEGIRLTARLDGFSSDDVRLYLDRARRSYLGPGSQYVVVDDDPEALGTNADLMSRLVDHVLIPAGQAVVHDTGPHHVTDAPGPVMGYVGHGSQAEANFQMSDLKFDYVPGAVMHTWESFNAYSFKPGANRYGQWLIGEWLADGGTAALGHVEEPTASRMTVANEDILFDMLLKGYTLAEAAWSATGQLSFVNTVVGDPLMSFRPWIPGDANLDGRVGLDDLDRVLGHWGSTAELYDAMVGELTGDGFVGLDDLQLVLENWPGGMASNQSGTVSVPAPSGWISLPAGLIWVGIRRRV